MLARLSEVKLDEVVFTVSNFYSVMNFLENELFVLFKQFFCKFPGKNRNRNVKGNVSDYTDQF